MRSFIHKIADALFPPTHNQIVVRHATRETLKNLMHRGVYNDCIYVLPYARDVVRACVHEAKFHKNEHAISLLAFTLSDYLMHLPKNDFFIIPIPLSRARYIERGYNQVALIADAASRDLKHVQVRTAMLTRTTHTRPQTELTKQERIENVRGAFDISHSAIHDISGRHLILLDDVVTTGATMCAAKALLSPHHPASITCLALAH